MSNDEGKLLVQLANSMQTLADNILEIKLDVKSIDKRVKNVELTIENEIAKSIKLIAEGHMGLVEKTNNMHEDVEEIKESVSILNFLQKQMIKNN